MPHPVVHAEIRSSDPDATRDFYGQLFGWTYTSPEGGFPGYAFVETGVNGALPTAIGPDQGGPDSVLFFVGVQDVAGTLERAEQLGGRTVQPATEVPGVTLASSRTPRATASALPRRSRRQC